MQAIEPREEKSRISQVILNQSEKRIQREMPSHRRSRGILI
jgi:hypothetical protein